VPEPASEEAMLYRLLTSSVRTITHEKMHHQHLEVYDTHQLEAGLFASEHATQSEPRGVVRRCRATCIHGRLFI
jgi:hypothetical protein